MTRLTLLLLTLPMAAAAREAPFHHAHPHGALALPDEGAGVALLAAAALAGYTLWRARAAMILGELLPAPGKIVPNAGAEAVTPTIANTGDRPVQVGSHYHFFEANPALRFDRADARGMRLDIPAGAAVRFEPGQARDATLVPLGGARRVFGFRGAVMGDLEGGAR